MIKWTNVVKFVDQGNPKPDRRIEKTEEEWRSILSPEEFRITRKKETERAHSSEMCNLFEPGLYACVCCGTLLFDSGEKFQSGTGWPSFTQPIKENAIAYHKDISFGRVSIEVTCNTCDAHLGHVFQDGPMPSGLRYCINAISLKKVKDESLKATFGGGCFWCTEAIFQELIGVLNVESGYSGGTVPNPTYKAVSSGSTGHAETIEVTYNHSEISYEDLLKIHLSTHNPTTLNRQGADKGSQYRSIIFYRTEEEKEIALRVLSEMQSSFDDVIVTEVAKFDHFYKAEAHHQNYFKSNPNGGYCQGVINPKLEKFRKLYKEKLIKL